MSARIRLNFNMDQNIVIYIGLYKAIAIVGSTIVSIAYGSWHAASRLTRVETKVEDLEAHLTTFEGRLDGAFSGRSPIALLSRGVSILKNSGLQQYIDARKTHLFWSCFGSKMGFRPYEVQESAFRFFDCYDFGDFEPSLKAAAFEHGISLTTVRRIAGIYLRDLYLSSGGV